jgi:hypothetical protein
MWFLLPYKMLLTFNFPQWKGIREIKYPDGSNPSADDSDDEGDGSDDDIPIEPKSKAKPATKKTRDTAVSLKIEESDYVRHFLSYGLRTWLMHVTPRVLHRM